MWEVKLAAFIGLYFVLARVFDTVHVHHDTGLSQHLRVLPQPIIEVAGAQPIPPNCAYVQYATSDEYLRLAMLNFKALREAGTAIDKLVVLYSARLEESINYESAVRFADAWGIEMRRVRTTHGGDQSSWSESFTKFEVFATEFDRVVYFDSDSMLLNTTLDELFSVDLDLALPQAYWLNNIVEKRNTGHKYHKEVRVPPKEEYAREMTRLVRKYERNVANGDPRVSSLFPSLPELIYEHHKWDNAVDFFANHVMVLRPSRLFYSELMEYVHNPWWWNLFRRGSLRRTKEYDMEVLNRWINDRLKKGSLKVGILSHKVYGVLTGEFREKFHRRFTVEPQYLPFVQKETSDEWDPREVVENAKLLHFSDSPIPKPWEEEDRLAQYNSLRIECVDSDLDEIKKEYPVYVPRMVEDCEAVRIWKEIREEFHRRWS